MTKDLTNHSPRRYGLGLAAAALMLGGVAGTMPILGIAEAHARPAPEGFADLIESLSPAVVQISAKRVSPVSAPIQGDPGELPEYFRHGPFKDFFERYSQDRGPHAQPQPGPDRNAMGSGFIIDADGIVVTNQHVVTDATDIDVKLKDGRTYPAKLLGADDKTDLAVLKIEAEQGLPSVNWGDSDVTRVGDWVLAVGNPFGFGGTVTAGIVSARGRDIGAGPYDDFIQIDAPINNGNSGGPLFNTDGQVIGVNTAIFSPNGGNVGIGFAIPSDIAQDVVAELRESGAVERGWLGVRIQPVSPDIADSLGLEKAAGALVATVTPDSPAAHAGIHQGDVVLEFAGTEVENLRDLTRAVAAAEVGSKEQLTVWRDGERKKLKVELGVAPAQLASNASAGGGKAEFEALGLTLAALDAETRDRYGIDENTDGVVVAEVDSSKQAAEKDLRPGDVIVRVGSAPVTDLDQFSMAVQTAEETHRNAVLLLVERKGDQRFVALELA